MDIEEAFAHLRVAARLYARTAPPKPPPPTREHMEAIRRREDAIYAASVAGVSDGEMAKVLGIPRENVSRIRYRAQERRGFGTPAPVVERRPVVGRKWDSAPGWTKAKNEKREREADRARRSQEPG